MTSSQLIERLFNRIVGEPQICGNAANALEFRPDPACESYFRPARRPRLTRRQMDPGAGIDELGMLARAWSASGCSLAGLVPDLREVSQALAEERREADGESSVATDYIYRMW